METNVIEILMMHIRIGQHLSNIWSSVHKKLSNSEAELKKAFKIQSNLFENIEIKLDAFGSCPNTATLTRSIVHKGIFPF